MNVRGTNFNDLPGYPEYARTRAIDALRATDYAPADGGDGVYLD